MRRATGIAGRDASLLLVPHWLDFLLHSLHWGDVPAYLGAFISLAFGVLSYRSSRRSKAAELEAKKHAQDALAAQQQTAEETKKPAAATERQTQLAELEAQAAEHAAEQAPWRIEKRPSGAAAVIDDPGHYLVNVTPRPKYDVSVEGSLLPDAVSYWDVIDGWGSVKLDTYPPAAVPASLRRLIVVHWKKGRTGGISVWRDELPD